jgi:hypothetical protein
MTAAVIDVTTRLKKRAAFKRAAKGEPMTKEEIRDWYIAATPAQQAELSVLMRAALRRLHDRPPAVLAVVKG